MVKRLWALDRFGAYLQRAAEDRLLHLDPDKQSAVHAVDSLAPLWESTAELEQV